MVLNAEKTGRITSDAIEIKNDCVEETLKKCNAITILKDQITHIWPSITSLAAASFNWTCEL